MRQDTLMRALRRLAARRRPSSRASNAFTLIEMLVVLGMLGILMGVSAAGIGAARSQARVAKANADVRTLVSAWLSYEAAYDDWPVEIEGDNLDANASNLGELLGDNPDKVVYLNVQMINGAFRDPWGTPYRFRLLNQSGQNRVREDFGATVTFPNRYRYAR